VRIVAGRHRGRRLAAPGAGAPRGQPRPTSDRLRESLFNRLTVGAGGDAVSGARVLDLFAGTGALGLEALSRGAARAVFVDNGRPAQRLIAANIAALDERARARLIATDATRLPPAPEPAFDLILLDPPYGRGLGERALARALAGGWIAPGALIVWEEGAAITPPPELLLLDSRRHGGTTLCFLRATAPGRTRGPA